jgi:hypothetical protein
MLRLRLVMLIVAAGIVLAGCGRDRETAEAATNAPIGIETNQMFVTIENRAGTPLLNVNVTIHAPGAPPYTRLITRLESSEKRDISLADFSSRDGTTLNLRMLTPRSVQVTGTDLTNKKYEAETRWKS